MSTRKTRIIYGDRARVRQITISSVVYSPCSCRSIKRFACGAMASSSFAYSCNWCSFCCTSTEVLVKHVFESHSADPLFTFPCPLAYGRCPHIFKLGSTYSSFQSHAKRKHHNWKDELLSCIPLQAKNLRPRQCRKNTTSMRIRAYGMWWVWYWGRTIPTTHTGADRSKSS